MSCCGRTNLSAPQGSIVGTPERAPAIPIDRSTRAYFRYSGTRPMIVVGRGTGTHYRFAGPGVIIGVDLRDRLSVAGVPGLHAVHPQRSR